MRKETLTVTIPYSNRSNRRQRTKSSVKPSGQLNDNTSMATDEDSNYVHYVMGGVAQKRAVLTGMEAKQTFNEIPSVDVSDVFSESLEVRKAIAAKLGKACEEVGFFYAVNPPVSKEKMGMSMCHVDFVLDLITGSDKAFEVIKKFFDQPLEEKVRVYLACPSPKPNACLTDGVSCQQKPRCQRV